MKISEAERLAIRTVLACAEDYGYGNLITHLQTAWAARLMRSGLDEQAARRHAGGATMPFLMQQDVLERGEWDETGRRYQQPQAAAADPRR